jgi:predicted DNA-binding transcriptional regulator YafY
VGGEDPIKVRLLFEPKLAVYITERQWHAGQEFRTRRDGRVEMRLETTGRKELVRWILSWMPDVKVLTPKSLRDRIMEKLRDGLQAQE